MRIEELDAVCRQAAVDLVAREGRPLPAAVVLPLAEATRVTTFPRFPDDDPSRFDLLTRFAADVMRPANAPAYGFVAEAVAAGGTDGAPVDVVVVVYGARGHHPRVTAAPLSGGEVGDFGAAEELAPAAFPFLSPLQHAVDGARPPDALPGGAGPGLPILPTRPGG